MNPALSKAQKILSGLQTASKGYFTQPFYKYLRVVEAKDVGATKMLTFDYTATQALRNSLYALHGGAVAALLDVSAILAVKTYAREGYTPVGTHVNVDYFKAGKLNEELKIEVTVLKTGKYLSFLRALVSDSNGVPMAQSSVISKNLQQKK